MKYSTLSTDIMKEIGLRLDEFSIFEWNGENSWTDHHAFIINNGEDLKFYNGAGFSNEYSSPQYQSFNNNLVGINFKIQTLSFKIGIYNVTAKEYSEVIEWLNPYNIGFLTFDFNQNWSYLVKLGERSEESPRIIIGYNNNQEPLYYTELNLKWDLQGPQCVRFSEPYSFIKTEESLDLTENSKTYIFSLEKDSNGDLPERNQPSFLNTPFVFEAPLIFTDGELNASIQGTLEIEGLDNYTQQEAFTVNFQNLPNEVKNNKITIEGMKKFLNTTTIPENIRYWTANGDPSGKEFIKKANDSSYYFENTTTDGIYIGTSIEKRKLLKFNNPKYQKDLVSRFILNFRYDSEAGLISIRIGSQTWRLLTFLTNDPLTGNFIVRTMNVNKLNFPGTSQETALKDKWKTMKFKLTLNNSQIIERTDINNNNYITAYQRTNVI